MKINASRIPLNQLERLSWKQRWSKLSWMLKMLVFGAKITIKKDKQGA